MTTWLTVLTLSQSCPSSFWTSTLHLICQRNPHFPGELFRFYWKQKTTPKITGGFLFFSSETPLSSFWEVLHASNILRICAKSPKVFLLLSWVTEYFPVLASSIWYLFSLSTCLYLVNTMRDKYGSAFAAKLQYININCTLIPPKHIYVVNLKTFHTAAYC